MRLFQQSLNVQMAVNLHTMVGCCHIVSSKEQVSFSFMAAVSVLSPENVNLSVFGRQGQLFCPPYFIKLAVRIKLIDT